MDGPDSLAGPPLIPAGLYDVPFFHRHSGEDRNPQSRTGNGDSLQGRIPIDPGPWWMTESQPTWVAMLSRALTLRFGGSRLGLSRSGLATHPKALQLAAP